MVMAQKYKVGMYLGPNSIYFKEELPKKETGRSKRLIRQGIFVCPKCGKEFTATLQDVYTGHTRTCGCSHVLDLTNQKFGYLTALYKTDKTDSSNNNYWHCICDCGLEVDVSATALKTLSVTSCGCAGRNLVGQTFGKLTVIKASQKGCKNKSKLWECKCSCGNTVYVGTGHLMSGHTQSCGCLNSKGELLINEILNYLNISYVSQKVFNGCINPKSKRNLRFDFYLPDYNTCIEYDGVQHYKILGWNDEKHFNEVVYRDSIKTKFCADNNIHLIRIPYTDYDKIDSQYLLDKLGM